MRFIPIVLAAAVVASNAASAQTLQSAPLPSPDDSWQFQTINLWTSNLISRSSKKILGISGDYVRMYIESQPVGQNGEITKPSVSEVTARADMNSTVVYHGEKQDRIWYNWPLRPGKKWSFLSKEEVPPTTAGGAPMVFSYTTDAEAVGWEALEVPAGKFKTMKIVYKTKWSAEGSSTSGTSVNTVWLSPDAKTVVQSVFESFGADGAPQTRTKTQMIHYLVK